MTSENFIMYIDYTDLTTFVKVFDCKDTNILDVVCTEAAKAYCWNDVNDIVPHQIFIGGREIKYKGWQPDMVFEFYDYLTKQTIWKKQFMQWEH